MDRFYKNQFNKLALLIVMLLIGGSTALAQTFNVTTPVCAGGTLHLEYKTEGGCTATSVQFTGPGGFSVAGTQGPTGTWKATRSNVTVSHAGTYFATPNIGSSCPTLDQSVTVHPLPLTPVISGAKDLCGLNNVVDYTVAPYNLNNKTAKWSVTSGAGFIVGDNNLQTVTINWSTTTPQGALNVTITDDNTGCSVTTTNYIVEIHAYPTIYEMLIDPNYNGGYCFGENGIKIGLDDSETGVSYLLKKDGVTIETVSGTGLPVWFSGTYTGNGTEEYTIEAATVYCNQPMLGSVKPEEYATPVAVAGSGGEVCSDNLASDAFQFNADAASTTDSGTSSPEGEWTYVGPGNATFSLDAKTATATVTVDEYGTYTFTWTVTNGPCEASDDVTVTFFHRPNVEFSFNGTPATTGQEFEYCYDENVVATLSDIKFGEAPFTISWSVEGPGGTTTDTKSGIYEYDELFNATLPAGTYTVTMTQIIDANGCEPTQTHLDLYWVKIVVNPEPAMDFQIGGNSILGTTQEFCFDEDIEINYFGTEGVENWNFKLQIEKVGGGAGYPFTINGHCGDAGDSQIFAANAFPLGVGTYTITITEIKDGNGCYASAASLAVYWVKVVVNPEPAMDFQIDGTSILGTTQEFCFDEDITISYFGTEGVEKWDFVLQIAKLGGEIPFIINGHCDDAGDTQTFAANAFPLGVGTYTITITEIKDGNGCYASAASLANYWVKVVVHPEPAIGFSFNNELAYTNSVFEYCEDDDVTVTLSKVWVGTEPFDISWSVVGPSGTVTDTKTGVQLNGELFSGTLGIGTHTVTITEIIDANGCSPATYDPYIAIVIIYENPIANAGADFTECNTASTTLLATPSVGSGKWTVAGPGSVNIANDTDPNTMVTVAVAGTYTFTWTETNGVCEDSDEVAVTFLKGIDADATTMDPIADISTIPNTPIFIEAKVTYPNLTGTDPSILVDGRISTTEVGGFPAGTNIIQVYHNTLGNIFNGGYDISGKESVLFSDFVQGMHPYYKLLDRSGLTETFTVIVELGNGQIEEFPVKVEFISYIDWDENCYAVLAEDDFTVTTEKVNFTGFDDVTECYPEDIVVEWCETYPLIENIGGTGVLNDMKFTFFADAAMTTTATLPAGTVIEVTTPNNYTNSSILAAAASQVYGSAVVSGQSDPSTNEYGYLVSLERPASAPDCWTVKISGVPAGTLFVKVEALALLDDDGSGYPYEEYVYDEHDFKVINVGAAGVTVEADPDAISTVTGAPVVFEVEVDYGDLNSQNIDPSVLVDALIEFNPPLPANAQILELLYNNNPISVTNPNIGGVNYVLLSNAIGEGPYPLANHDGRTDTWKITVIGIDTPGTYTATLSSIAYVDYSECYSVMGADTIVVEAANLETAYTEPAIICEGEDAEFTVSITYPQISNIPTDILTDALLQFDQDVDAGVSVEWEYDDSNSSHASGTYTLPSQLNKGDFIKLSEILGNSSTPLLGHNLLEVTWTITISNLDRPDPPAQPVYNLQIIPIVTLGSADYNLEQNNAIPEIPITVYKAIDPEITGPASVFSGGVYSYEVEKPMDGTPSYKWTTNCSSVAIADDEAQVATLTFTWDDPLPCDQVYITVVVGNGVCTDTFDYEVEVLPNKIIGQLKYYNEGNTPMPSPYKINVPIIGELTDYFYVSLVNSDFDIEMGDPYFDYNQTPGVLETSKVQVDLIEIDPEDINSIIELEAAFRFDYNLDPTEEYRLVVWDGGFYEIGLSGMEFLLYTWTWNNWNSEGTINGGDGLLLQHMAVGNQVNEYENMCHIGANTDIQKYGFFAQDVGDVNDSGGITALDALQVVRRSLNLDKFWITNPAYRKPNFVVMGIMDELNPEEIYNNDFSAFEANYWCDDTPMIQFRKRGFDYTELTPASEHNYYNDEPIEFGLGWKYFNIFYSNVGDIRGLTEPNLSAKSTPTMDINYTDVVAVSKGAEVVIPVSLDRYADLGAISLGLKYRNDLIEVVATNFGADNAMIDHENGMVRIAWYSIDGMQVEADVPVALITVKVLNDFSASTRLFELTNYTELVDPNVNTIGDINFKALALTTDASEYTGALAATNYPNPFNDQTTISYNMPVAGNVSLIIYNKMGQIVKTLVDDYQNSGRYEVKVNSTDLNGPGVYYYRLEVKGENSEYSSSNSMILIR